MNNYVPFLKLKVNEIAALSVLAEDIKGAIVPFFDLAKKDEMTGDEFKVMVTKGAKSLTRHVADFPAFFLDNFDIDDTLAIDGEHNYAYVLTAFRGMNFIPVVGLDRVVGRNELVFTAKKNGLIKSDSIALRLLSDDFENFALVADDIAKLMKLGHGLFSRWILVLDNRVCADIAPLKRAASLANFLVESAKLMSFQAIIVTGSSLPPSIGDILKVLTEREHGRTELSGYRALNAQVGGLNLYCGDYTVVSPLYSDVELPVEILQNVMTPKVVYTYGDVHYMARGGAFKTHPRAHFQYNDICEQIIKKHFYRQSAFSFGDNFLWEKAQFVGKQVTPNSILKPTINTHITYMFRNFKV